MSVKNILCGSLIALVSLGLSSAANANLIKNASFEDVPDASTGQGILPSDWVNIPPPTPTADTYSNDGSYGVIDFKTTQTVVPSSPGAAAGSDCDRRI